MRIIIFKVILMIMMANLAFAQSGASFVNTSGDTLMTVDTSGTVSATAFIGDGSGLTNLPPGNGWSLTGNAGTDTTTNFIGTTDNMPLDIRVNNTRGLRIIPTFTPAIIGGYSGNTISNSNGSIIAGGGDFNLENQISNAYYSSISGGRNNTISGTGIITTVTISGGDNNTASQTGATVGGGGSNMASALLSTTAGGGNNTASGVRSTVGGGHGNTASGTNATIAGGGGFFNGSLGNTASGYSSTVPGGSLNSAGGAYSFASGRRAKIDAAHHGTFLFADQNNLDFNSAAANEFAARATGGVRFVTAIDGSGNPTQTVSIDNSGTVTAPAFVGDGSGLTNLPSGNGWSLTGNAGTDTTTNFIGTTDNMPLVFRVNNINALRIVPGDGGFPNLIGGASDNFITSGFSNTISGGGYTNLPNRITRTGITPRYSTISGGADNLITNYSSTIGGGVGNEVTGSEATIAGGSDNTASGLRATVGGGYGNTASGTNATIAGGGGFFNGSLGNTASGYSSTVPGGSLNSAGGDYSFASGRRAKIDAAHDGAFLFSDQNDFDFNSAAANEFAARATGGVRFVTAIDGSGNPTQTVSINNSGTVSATAFIGDGSGLTNLPPGNGWSLTDNAGTDTTNNFIGTTDNMPLDFRVNNKRGFRISPGSNGTSPNLIGGYKGNTIDAGHFGATISGGGNSNEKNVISRPGNHGTIGGGVNNLVSNGYSTVSGGSGNQATSQNATIAGGQANTVSGLRATVGGGAYNTASGANATVAGGGGYNNGPIGNTAGGYSSAVPGGSLNSAGGDYSFASGRRAKIDAAHDGAFLFADQNNFDFNSASANEFAARATGGVRFVTAIDGSGNPAQTISMDNTGTVTASAFVGDGSGLTGLPSGADNLGNHTATQNIKLDGNYLSGDGGNEGVFVDGNGNAGVGLATPQTKLEVEDTTPEIRLTDGRTNSGGVAGEELGKLSWYTRDTTNPNNYHPVAAIEVAAENSTVAPDGRFLFRTGSNGDGLSTRMVISNEGNVGIGTTNPTTPLAILGNGGTNPVGITQNQVGSTTTLELTTTDLDGDQATRLLFRGGTDNANVEFYTGARGSESSTMFIGTSGDVGIGNTAPSAKLDVSGTVKIEDNFNEPALQIINNLSTSGVASALVLANDDNKKLEIGINSSGHNQPNEAYVKVRQGSALTFDFTDGERMRIMPSGNVGIGTTNPARGKLDIAGTSSSTINLSYGYLNSSGNTGTYTGSYAYSVYATDRIAAQEFNAHSDERIKNIKGITNAANDLNTLMQIQVIDYTMRDSVEHDNTSHKKVIAQQVARVYPQAVKNNLTEVVPDIYKRAKIENGWVKLATDMQPGDKVKLISTESNDIYNVLAVHEGAFQVDLEYNGDIFVYGRQVDDFHTVDYEAISMLNVSATQEQQRRIEALEARLAAKDAELKELKEQVAGLSTLQAKVSQIEQALEKLDKETLVKLTSATR